MRNADHRCPRSLQYVGVGGRYLVALDYDIAVGVEVLLDEVDVDEAARGVLRIEGEREQSVFANERKNAGGYVEKGIRQQDTSIDDTYFPPALGDEKPRIAGRRLQIHGGGRRRRLSCENILQAKIERLRYGRRRGIRHVVARARRDRQRDSNQQQTPALHGRLLRMRRAPSNASPRSARARRARSLPREPKRSFLQNIYPRLP